MVSPDIEHSHRSGINWTANTSAKTDIIFLDESFTISNDGIPENSFPSPGVSNVPLMPSTSIRPRDIEEAQNANKIEAIEDLTASIISSSVPAHDSDPKSVDAAKDAERKNPTTATSSKLASSLLFELTNIIVAIPTDVNVKVTMVSISSNSGAISGMAETAMKRIDSAPVLKWLGIPSSETERTLPKDAASAAASGRVRIRRYPSFSIVPFAKASDPRKSATKATNMAETGTSSFREFPSAFASSLTFIGFTVCLA